MVNFYINYNHPGTDIAHLCERANENGTIDWIFISQFGPYSKIRTAKGVKSSVRFKNEDFKPTSGVEFINAYIDATSAFQRLSTSLFSEINL